MWQLIEDPTRFAELLRRLPVELLIAVDTEAASCHRHRDRIYLLQVSTRTETWLIDPLAVPGLPGLGNLLADPGLEFVFHDAAYDLRLLGHQFDYRVSRLFDTRVAAQFLNEPGIGLAALLEKYLGVRLDKQYQRADWSLRPLTPPLLQYAATDTQHLLSLRDTLRHQLLERGRLSWVEEECELLTRVRWPEPESPDREALSVRGARVLSPRELAVFRELYGWRASIADALDRAAFRILGNDTLFALAKSPPGSLERLSETRGVGRELAARRGTDILQAIQRGLAIPDAELPHFPRAPRRRPDPAFEERMARLKSVRSSQTTRFQLPPGVLCPNWLLESIARLAPRNREELAQVNGIRRWQLRELGDELVNSIAVVKTTT